MGFGFAIEVVSVDCGEQEVEAITKNPCWKSKSEQRGSSDRSEPPIAHTDPPKQNPLKGWTSLNPPT